MAITVNSQPNYFTPVYNDNGEYEFESDLNTDANVQTINTIGTPSEDIQEQWGVDATDIFLYTLDFTGGGQLIVGGYVIINGTVGYDGTYYVRKALAFGDAGFILEGVNDGTTENVGTIKTLYKEHRIKVTITPVGFTDAAPFTLTSPFNSEGIAKVCVSDFLKDYFKFLYSFGNATASFNPPHHTFRFNVSYFESYREAYDELVGVYRVRTVTSEPESGDVRAAVNASLRWGEAQDLGGSPAFAFQQYYNLRYDDNQTQALSAKFNTYRPRNSYAFVDDFISLGMPVSGVDELGASFAMTIKSYDAEGTELQSDNISAPITSGTSSLRYEVGYSQNIYPFPTGLAYYTCKINAGTSQSETFRFDIRESCRSKYQLYWKNEFGECDTFTFLGSRREADIADHETAQRSTKELSIAYPSNYRNIKSESTHILVLNTGRVNTEHAKWLNESLSRATEIFLQPKTNPNVYPNITPVMLRRQTSVEVNDNRNTHEVEFEFEIPMNNGHIGAPIMQAT